MPVSTKNAKCRLQRLLLLHQYLCCDVQVVAAGPGDMRMYYHSFDKVQRRFVVGWASSPDGFK